MKNSILMMEPKVFPMTSEFPKINKPVSWTSKPPTEDQCVEVLVKCLRLRKLADAIYWYLNCAKMGEETLKEANKRLLIACAADGFNLTLMRLARRWWRNKGWNADEHCIHGGVSIIGILHDTPTWWNSPTGREYVDLLNKDTTPMLQWYKSACLDQDFLKQLEIKAIEASNLPARMLVSIARTPELYDDESYALQATMHLDPSFPALLLALAPMPKLAWIQDIYAAMRIEVQTKPRMAPKWALDEYDPRFSSVPDRMAELCDQFVLFPRSSPGGAMGLISEILGVPDPVCLWVWENNFPLFEDMPFGDEDLLVLQIDNPWVFVDHAVVFPWEFERHHIARHVRESVTFVITDSHENGSVEAQIAELQKLMQSPLPLSEVFKLEYSKVALLKVVI